MKKLKWITTAIFIGVITALALVLLESWLRCNRLRQRDGVSRIHGHELA